MFALRFEGVPKDPSLQKVLWSRLHAKTFDVNFDPSVKHEGPRSTVIAETTGNYEAVDQISRWVFQEIHADIAEVHRTDTPETPVYRVSLVGMADGGRALPVERIFGQTHAALWHQLQHLSVQVIEAANGDPTMVSVDVIGRTMLFPPESPEEAREKFLVRFREACPQIEWEA